MSLLNAQSLLLEPAKQPDGLTDGRSWVLSLVVFLDFYSGRRVFACRPLTWVLGCQDEAKTEDRRREGFWGWLHMIDLIGQKVRFRLQ